MRMSYKDYKRYDVGYGVDGTYDKETKTIEVNIGRCVKAIMNVLPESYVKETNLSRAKAAQKLYFDIGNGLITVDGDAPAWAKKHINSQRLVGVLIIDIGLTMIKP